MSVGQIQVLCISISFWVLRSPKSWLNYFFQPFSIFLFFLNPLQWVHPWNQQKNLKINKRKISLTSFRVRAAPKSWLKYTTYRHLSCLPSAAKLLELLICQQSSLFLESNNLLPHTQHGFRKHRSTMTTRTEVEFRVKWFIISKYFFLCWSS